MKKLTELSDVELATGFQDLVIDEQSTLATQLEHLAEMDRRKLFFEYASLRAYLVAERGMEEWVAERRIRAARLLKRFPFLLSKIQSGQLNLTLLEIAQGCAYREKLSDVELAEILETISGMSCNAARRELAAQYPTSMELPHDRIRPLTGEHSEVRFVATQELLEKLDEIRGLLAHSHPKLSLGQLIDHLATDFRERHHPAEKAKRAKERAEKKDEQSMTETIKRPTPKSTDLFDQKSVDERRTFSKAVVHQLINRDGYRCSYVDPLSKKRCDSSFALEIDHIRAWALGGKSELANARFACRNHHRRISYLQFGKRSKYISGSRSMR